MINLSKTSAEGVAALKAFLEYASGRELPVTANTVASASEERSSIADEIVRRLKEEGYESVRSVGRSKFRIDVGVIDLIHPIHISSE